MKIGGATFEWGARTYVMGVLNITPDSFSGDGLRPENKAAIEAAAEQAVRFEREGAHILDIGGESTRPPGVYDGARSVGVQEELERVLPVIEAVRAAFSLPVSIDTRKAAVARAAGAAGAGGGQRGPRRGWRRCPTKTTNACIGSPTAAVR